jgi:hypothetical protein
LSIQTVVGYLLNQTPEQSKPPADDNDAITLNEGTSNPDVKGKKKSRKEMAAFSNDDTSTLAEGKGRRDVNGKIMTKRELAAEGALRVIVYSCVVM